MRRRISSLSDKPANSQAKPVESDSAVESEPQSKGVPPPVKLRVVPGKSVNVVAIMERKRMLQREVLRLKTEGYTHIDVARQLGITKTQVISVLTEALDEYNTNHKSVVERFRSLQMVRMERIFREYIPRAETSVVIEKDEEGNEVERVIRGDTKAATILIKAMDVSAKMMGLNKSQVEVSGVNSVVNIDKAIIANLPPDVLRRFSETKDISLLQAYVGVGHDSGRAGPVGGSAAPPSGLERRRDSDGDLEEDD